jgi:hypothetical protein
MGQLYLLYGITSDSPGPFINLTDQDYWTNQIVGSGPAYYYFTFNPDYLKQYFVDGSFIGWDPNAMALFDGAPDASPVPDAGSSLLLLGMSLAGLRAWRTRLG